MQVNGGHPVVARYGSTDWIDTLTLQYPLPATQPTTRYPLPNRPPKILPTLLCDKMIILKL